MDISSLTSAHMHTDDEGNDSRDDEDRSRLDAQAAGASAEQSATVDMSQEPEQHEQDSDDDSDMSEHYPHEQEQEHDHIHIHAAHHQIHHTHPHRSLSPPRRSPSPIIALPTRRATMPRLAKTRASALASVSMLNGMDSHDGHLVAGSSSALHLNRAGSEKGGDMPNGNGSESDDNDATPDKSAKSARVSGSNKGKSKAGNAPASRSKVAIRAAKARAASEARNHHQAASDPAVTQDVHYHHDDDDDVDDEEQAAGENASASTSLSGIANEVPTSRPFRVIQTHRNPLRGDSISINPKKKRLPSKVPRKSTAGAPREHTCEHCTKAFARKSDLIRHIRTHMGDKPFACACGKAFIQASALRVHERTHTGEKPYQCPHCTKCFADSSSLVRHKRVHTGERPYLCPMPGCDRAFCRNVTLLKHQLREHGVEAMKQDGKPYLSLVGGTRPKRSHGEMAGAGEDDDENNEDERDQRETSTHAIEAKIELADDGLPVEEASNGWYDDDSRGSYYAGADDDADDADYGRTRRAPKKKARKPAAARKRPAAKKSRVPGEGASRDAAAPRQAAHPFSVATTAGGAQEGGSYPGSHALSPAMVLDPYAYAAHPAYDGRYYYPHPARQPGVATMAGHPYSYAQAHAHAHAQAHAHAHAMQAAYAWGAMPGVAPPVTRDGTPASMASHRSRASLVEAAQAQEAAAAGNSYGAAAISPGMTLGDTAAAIAGGAASGSHSAAASDVHMASATNSDAGGQGEAEMHYYARSQRPVGLHLQIPFSATSPAAAGAMIKPARSADPLKPSQTSHAPGSPGSVRSCVSAPEAAMVAATTAGHAQEKGQSSSKASDEHASTTKSAGQTLEASAPTYDGQHQKQHPSFLAQAQQHHGHYRAVPAPLQVHPHTHAYAGQVSAQTPTGATPATYGSAYSPMAPLSAGQTGYAHPGMAHYASPHASSAAHYHYYGYAHPHMQQQQAAHHPHYSHYPRMQHQEHLPTPGSAATSFFSGAQSADHRSSITSASLISPYQQQQVSATAGAHVQPYGQQHHAYMQQYAPAQQYHAQPGQMYYPPASAAEVHAKQMQDAAVGAVATSAAAGAEGQQYYHYPVPALLARAAQSNSAQSYGSQEHPLRDAQASQQSMQSTYGKDHEQALLPAFDQQQHSSASLSEEARSNSQAGQSDHLTQIYTTAAIGERSDGSMQFDPPFSASSHESAFPESDFLLAASRKASLASVGNASPFEPIFPMDTTLGQTLVAGEDGL